MKRLELRVVLVLILLTLMGCSTGWLGLDSGLFRDGPCKAPCWQGLIPGQSTSEDVDRFLDQQSSRNGLQKRDEVLATGCRSIRLTDIYASQALAVTDLHLEAGNLSFVESTPLLGPTLERVVDHFGPPEYFEGVQYRGAEGYGYVVEVYYPGKGLAFQLDVHESAAGRINPDMRVLRIDYFEPGDLISYFATRYSCDFGQAYALEQANLEVESLVQTWSGFGEVKVITEGPPQQ